MLLSVSFSCAPFTPHFTLSVSTVLSDDIPVRFSSANHSPHSGQGFFLVPTVPISRMFVGHGPGSSFFSPSFKILDGMANPTQPLAFKDPSRTRESQNLLFPRRAPNLGF